MDTATVKAECRACGNPCAREPYADTVLCCLCDKSLPLQFNVCQLCACRPRTTDLGLPPMPDMSELPSLPTPTERRRYALLQAAAVILGSAGDWSGKEAVHEAEFLLAEIERREKEKEDGN